MAILRTQGLTKHYSGPDGREIAALGPLDLTVADGEFVCIVGPSGCGKSTLLRLLAGLESPTAGLVSLAAHAEGKQPFSSMVFQGDSTFPWMTVSDNIGYGLSMRGLPLRQRYTIVAELLQTVGLTRFADAYPYQLSGGMRQRVALARALANDPQVLLMDEPFGALDAQTRSLLQNELLQIWDRKRTTVLFVTHSIDEALALGDRVLVMSASPGRIVYSLDVPFTRPRDVHTLRRAAEFGELTYAVWEALRDEVDRARLGELEHRPGGAS